MTDLKSEVIDLLNSHDPELAKKFIKRFRLVIGQNTEEEQVKALCYFWSTELGMLPFPTIEQREYLQFDVDGKTWFQRFKKHVLPVVLANKLPR